MSKMDGDVNFFPAVGTVGCRKQWRATLRRRSIVRRGRPRWLKFKGKFGRRADRERCLALQKHDILPLRQLVKKMSNGRSRRALWSGRPFVKAQLLICESLRITFPRIILLLHSVFDNHIILKKLIVAFHFCNPLCVKVSSMLRKAVNCDFRELIVGSVLEMFANEFGRI